MRQRPEFVESDARGAQSSRSDVTRGGSSEHPDPDSSPSPRASRASQRLSLVGVVGLAILSAATPGCAEEFDTSRSLPKRGTVGEEMFGVICDRVGAQALREDLTGASFREVCHRPQGGNYADKVDLKLLPEIRSDAVDEQGKPVSVEAQETARERAVGRIEALARRRQDLIRAFDATFPDVGVAIKDLGNPDETKSCNAPKKSGEGSLPDELARMLGKFGDLYNDGTIPQSTQSLARVIEAFKASDEGQAAWARISARQGYRPIETALGTARPIVAYPNLRDLSNASLRLLSADSNPYELDPKRDGDGNRIPVPGPGNAALNKMLEAGHEEMLAVTADPVLPPLQLTTDAATGRIILSRPRETLEMIEQIMFLSDPAFGGGGSTPRYIVKRDRRGYAAIAGGAVPAPFIDADKDGLPDVDDVGRFKTTDGSLAPSPFPYPGGVDGVRDNFGRSILQTGQPLYEYLDTTKTFAAQMMTDMLPLVNPDPAAEHETLMNAVGGLYVAMGARARTSKSYANGKVVEYDGVSVADSPMLDLVHALGVILGDRNTDATLQMAKELFTKHEPQMARVTGALSTAFDVAQKYPDAKIPKDSTFWDENLDAMAKLAKEPGLLEDVLKALADPATAQLGNIFANYAKYKDEVSYNKLDINGGPFNVTTNSTSEMRTPVDRAQPITGKNRSALYRFLSLINDTMGVTACNKEGAKVHAELGPIKVTMPIGGSYKECEVFKIDNLGAFYLDSIAQAYQYEPASKPNKRGTFYLRNDLLRTGIAGIGAATVSLMENSSGLTGFWTTGTTLAAKPEWLNRLVFFDVQGDNVNTKTKTFIVDLQGEHMGTSVCPERAPFADPDPTAPDASPDGMIRGLRNCPEGLWLDQRGKNTIFTWEHFGFYDAIRPLLGAFVKHGREDLFLELSAAAYRHMGGADATADECRITHSLNCKRENGVSYEPLMIEALAGDVLPAVTELARTLDTLPITKCVASDAKGTCTQTQTVSGVDVAAAATRAMMDADYARSNLKLTDRNGGVTAKRNDGTTNPQTTPIYLITSALSGIDAAFDAWEAQHPEDTKRRANWRKARSQLVDQFMGVRGAKITSTFANPAMPKLGPVLVDLLRSQLLARCPTSFTPPYDRCAWARDELVKKATDSLGGPLVSSGLEMMDAIRRDDEGRKQMNMLLRYLVDAASQHDALASMLASANDIVQVMRDDQNIVPLLHVVASAMDASVRDKEGRIVQKSLVDAQTALLARLSGKYFDKEGRQICAREVDPNQVLSIALGKLVTPIKDDGFKGQTPLEVIIDVIADVNRVDPTQPYEGTLEKSDYNNVSAEVFDFLMNKERGMEQFYEVIRQGTRF